MSLTDFLGELRTLHKKHGMTGLRVGGENFLRGLAVRFGSLRGAFSPAVSVLEDDWDLFIVLDACRWDIMAGVAEEYDWLDPQPIESYASSSQDWLQKTFFRKPKNRRKRIFATVSLFREPYQNDLLAETLEHRDLSDVAYITGNPQSTMLDESWLAHLEETWRGDFGHYAKTREITDRTIRFRRANDIDQTIVHYMKPHEPFTKDPSEGTAWQRLQQGEYPLEELVADYKENLRDVLDDVELLLENTDAENVVICADHGNSYGEWGFYGHRPYLPLSGMRKVPVAHASATDEGTRIPSVSELHDEVQAEEKLRELGYL